MQAKKESLLYLWLTWKLETLIGVGVGRSRNEPSLQMTWKVSFEANKCARNKSCRVIQLDSHKLVYGEGCGLGQISSPLLQGRPQMPFCGCAGSALQWGLVFVEEAGATGSGPSDGSTWSPSTKRAKRLAKPTRYPLLEEQAASRKLLPCLRRIWPIQDNWANNFLLNADGKSPISCPNQQGLSIIAFTARGVFFSVGPPDWIWLRTWSWWEVEVRGSHWNVQQRSYVDVEFCKNLVQSIARKPGNHGSSQQCCGISDIDVKQTPLTCMYVLTLYIMFLDVYTVCIYT